MMENSIEWIMQESKDVDGVDSFVKKAELVRCKDCKYWRGRKYNKHINGFLPWCGFSALQREADEFCSHGKRKDGDECG